MKTNATRQISMLGLLLAPLFVFGQAQLELRESSPFTGVSASGVIAVVLTQADEYVIEVETTAGQFDDVKTTVRRNTLELEYTGSARRPENITVYVTAPEFTNLSAIGASTFTSYNTLQSPSLTISGSGATSFKLSVDTETLSTGISGATNMTLSGRAHVHQLKASGACLVDAYELVTEVSEANISGASSAKIYVNDVLRVDASGSSNVSYMGNPSSQQFTTSGFSKITGRSGYETTTSQETADTVIVRMGQRELQVVDGHTQKPQVTIRKRPYRHFRDNWTGIELGINGFLSPDNKVELPAGSEQFDLDYRKSIAVNLNLWQQNIVLAKGHLGLVTGLGIGWNNYRFLTNDVLVKGPGEVEFEEGLYEFKKNKLTVTHLNVPLLLEFQTSLPQAKQFHISAGMNVGLRIGSHTKQMVFIDGDREKFKDHNDLYLNPFRYEATARIGWGVINLFASYALNDLFREGKGPELTPFAVGIRLGSF